MNNLLRWLIWAGIIFASIAFLMFAFWVVIVLFVAYTIYRFVYAYLNKKKHYERHSGSVPVIIDIEEVKEEYRYR